MRSRKGLGKRKGLRGTSVGSAETGTKDEVQNRTPSVRYAVCTVKEITHPLLLPTWRSRAYVNRDSVCQ